jgi:hypothetical protein
MMSAPLPAGRDGGRIEVMPGCGDAGHVSAQEAFAWLGERYYLEPVLSVAALILCALAEKPARWGEVADPSGLRAIHVIGG